MDHVISYPSVANPFFIESIQEGTDLSQLKYSKRGEPLYAEGRQVLVRSCHDALVSCKDARGQKGLLLIKRVAEPAKGYVWSLGGFFDRGIPTEQSLASRILDESGLEVNEQSYVVLGHMRAMWKAKSITQINNG